MADTFDAPRVSWDSSDPEQWLDSNPDPTPDVTPPSDDTSPSDDSGSLSDLFADGPVAAGDHVVPVDSPADVAGDALSDLGDLFPDATDTGSDSDTDAGPAEAGSDSDTAAGSAVAWVPTAPAAPKGGKKAAGSGDLLANARRALPDTVTTPAAAPAAAPATPPAAAPVTVPAARRPAPAAPAAWMTARRWERTAALWSSVQALLGFVGNDPFLSDKLADFTITRDRQRDTDQRQRFIELLSEKAIGQRAFAGLSRNDVTDLFEIAYDEYLGLGPIAPLWWDDDVTEILVDAYDRVYVERNGYLEPTPVTFVNADHANTVARTLSSKVSNRMVSPTNPLVTAELPGARITFCYGEVVKTGLSVTLRKFRPLLGMDGLLSRGALNDEMRDFLAACVTARATAIISGGTGTGKTTAVNALSEFIPDNERVVTIEDAYELQLSNRYVVNLQTKEIANADSQRQITQADLMVNALRMRPDRIIVGEIREPKGAQVMLQAANTGHDGTMSTIHANTTHAALNFRLAGLVQTASGMSSDVALREVATAIDLVVQVTRRAGVRFISEIAVVDPSNVHGNEIRPTVIFTGALGPDGTPVFTRVGSVGADTVLAVKFTEAGIDASRWEEGPR